MSRRLNAYFSHGEAEYFLAMRGGRVVGRVTAQIDHAFNEFHKSRSGCSGSSSSRTIRRWSTR